MTYWDQIYKGKFKEKINRKDIWKKSLEDSNIVDSKIEDLFWMSKGLKYKSELIRIYYN